MWCWAGASPWWWSRRRQVLVVMVFMVMVCLLHLLVQHRVVQLHTSLRLPAGRGSWGWLGRETPVTPRSPTTPPTHPTTSGRRSETKNLSHRDAFLKNDHHQDDPLKNTVILSSWPPKVKFPLMVFLNVGRLGNRLNMYATALTFRAAHRAAATVAITRDSMLQLTTLLDPANLTLPVVDKYLLEEANEEEALERVIPDYLKNDMVSHLEPAFQRAEKKYRESGEPKLYTMEGYQNRMWMLTGHHHTIRAAFRIREDLKQKAARFLDEVRRKNGRRDVTFVSFHIRRTDYTRIMKTFFNCTAPGPAFYHSAMNHYRATLQNPVFVVASDDLSYARQHLNTSKDVVFSDMKTAAEDMALLGSCSHSIMTVGSYGFWASFLAGGEVVYPLLANCSVTPFVHPDTLGPRGYENFKPFDINGGGPV